ncbi:MAG: TRAP transporter substrate-binding protein [Oscillospiraceae bacterium]
MKKRLLALLCSTAMLLSLVTACSGGSDKDTGSNTGNNTGNSGSSNAGTSDSPSTAAPGNTTSDEKFVLISGASANEDADYYNTPFKKIIEETSGGRITVEVYNNATLGTEYEMVEGVQFGDYQMTFSATAVQANFVPAAAVLDIPFLFDNMEDLREAAFGDFYDALAKEYEASGYHLLGFGTQGFRQTTSNKPIYTLDDLKGLKIRTMETPYHIATWQALGCNPTPIAFSELYLALQQGTVDAQENPYENIVIAKLYEQQDYVIETNHIALLIGWVMNKDVYDSMSPELQGLVDDAARQVLEKNWDDAAVRNEQSLQTIIDSGTEFITLDPAVLAEFRAATAKTEEMVRENVGNDVVDRLLSTLK